MPNKDTRNQYHKHSFRKSYSFGKPSVKVMMSKFSFYGDGERKLCELEGFPLNCIVKLFSNQSFSRCCTLMTSCGERWEKVPWHPRCPSHFLTV